MTGERFEVHAHAYVAGPLSRRADYSFDHAHADGSRGHKHPDTGPACFTIDADRWAAETGMQGGGKKVFKGRPTGLQLEYVERTPEESRFAVIFHPTARGVDTSPDAPAAPAVARMALTFDKAPEYEALP